MNASTHVPSPARSLALSNAEWVLREQFRRGEAQLRELESKLADLLRDRDVIEEDRSSARQVVDTVRADVLTCQRALTRIAEGRFGWCTACGDAIPSERLEAVPTAERCARCV
ncbi:MAG TPA: TraR/DksA family transcriptional regulator [Ilumatobacter sp.]|nr:TraR/DksA family transcriptional regulator [Ilumatobacter sp.]